MIGMPPVWSCEISQTHTLTLLLSGELAAECASELQDILLEQLDSKQALDVDLSAVTFIDSSALTVLVRLYNKARAHQLQFRIIASSRPVSRILAITGLDHVLTGQDDHAELAAA